jgi:hypothetical protein
MSSCKDGFGIDQTLYVLSKRTSPRSWRLAVVIWLLAISSGGAANACALHASSLDFSGFNVAHRGVLPVAVATREAVASGRLSALPKDAIARKRTLQRISRRASTHMQSLAKHSRSGPTISVLLAQTGAWMRFNDPIFGAMYHVPPPRPQDAVIVLPDVAYAAILDGALNLDELIELKLMRVYGTDDPSTIHAVFAAAMQVKTKYKQAPR